MKYNIIAITIATILLTSCEKEIIIDVPSHEPKLVINSVTYTNDTIGVMLSKSIDILQHKYGSDLSVKNAEVQLQVGNSTPVTLKYNNITGMYESNIKAAPGTTYNIKAKAAGFTEASALTRSPREVKIQSLQRINNVRLDMEGTTQDELILTFDDPAGEKNYYIIAISSLYVANGDDEVVFSNCINTSDPSVETIYDESIDQNTCIDGNGIFLRDDLFDGKRKELRLFIRSADLQSYEIPGHGTVYPTIEIKHVTEEYFRYLKSSRYASVNSGNPFAEPTNVYSNIKNGYGIFSIHNVDINDIK